jgi:hypothetical protein
LEARIVEFSLEQPAFGQIRVANEMRKLGHSVSPAGARGRLAAPRSRDNEEAKVAQEGLIPGPQAKCSAAFSANPLVPLL